MDHSDGQELGPKLEKAQKALERALDEACGVDLKKANTGELIRIDETLALASKAAKEAVSMRLKLRAQGGKTRSRSRKETKRSEKAATQAPPSNAPEVRPPEARREFADEAGKAWHAFAVRPSSPKRTSLPDAYRGGWLAFECEEELRRFAPIPPRWELLSDNELVLLCAAAEPAPRRTDS